MSAWTAGIFGVCIVVLIAVVWFALDTLVRYMQEDDRRIR